jgi:hypothetical protein
MIVDDDAEQGTDGIAGVIQDMFSDMSETSFRSLHSGGGTLQLKVTTSGSMRQPAALGLPSSHWPQLADQRRTTSQHALLKAVA